MDIQSPYKILDFLTFTCQGKFQNWNSELFSGPCLTSSNSQLKVRFAVEFVSSADGFPIRKVSAPLSLS